jgi:hypothetical protein
MECYCDYEPPSAYSARVVTARKGHACEECGRLIEPGEQYERAGGVWEDEPRTYKTCRHCLALRSWIEAHIPCFCWAHGNMIQDARGTLEALTDETSDTAGVLFGAGRRLVAIRRERQMKGRAPHR